MSDFRNVPTDQLREKALAAERLLRISEAREQMEPFMRLMMPSIEDYENPAESEYQSTPQGKMFCNIIEQTHKGNLMRTAVSVPPQMGKTIHLSTFGPAWLLGLNPRLNIILATYNETRASELGSDFRALIRSTMYRQIFPNVQFAQDSESKTFMKTTAGGKLSFVGEGGTITGRPADIFIIDDPIKGEEQAESETARERLWKWFYSVAYSRGGNKTRIIVLHTRWHEDDLIGRLCDPDHPERNKRYAGISDDWKYWNLPGVVKDPKLAKALGLTLKVPKDPKVLAAFGKEPMVALWENEKGLAFYAQWRRGQPRSFDALVMGKPSPDDGSYFLSSHIVEYHSAEELPTNLRIYAASDHALTEKAKNDATVLGCVGIDENDDIWVLPDLVWDRMETDRTVEEMLAMMQRHRPDVWFMEDEMISKSFGPFLKRRMHEERVYCMLDPVRPTRDKRSRARSIQGRMAMGKVRFPAFAPWYQQARQELLKFPYATHDDFVDWLAHIGQGLTKEVGATKKPVANENAAPVGSIAWVKRASAVRSRQDAIRRKTAGW